MNSNETERNKKGLKTNSMNTYDTGIYASFHLQVFCNAVSHLNQTFMQFLKIL